MPAHNISLPLEKPPHGSTPHDKTIASICFVLQKQFASEERERKYAPVKEVLTIIGTGVALSAAILAPKSAPLIRDILRKEDNWDAWKHYNTSYLKRTLQNLEKQKIVEVIEENDQQIIRLTTKGERKILKYSIEHLAVEKPHHWDGNWRLVLYDIPKENKSLGDVVRQALRALGFYPIQESVYLYPYSCFDQIEFIREYYNLGNCIQYMLVTRIENDQAYRTYFNLS